MFWYEIEPSYTDLLDKDAVKAFIDFTHNTYKKEIGEYFGKTVKGIFTDEPALNGVGISWNPDLPDWYREEYGEELIPNLWRLVEGRDQRSADFRLKWWNLIQKKYNENYIGQLYDWCEKNDIALTGHLASEDGLTYQIPSCGGVMRHYKYMQLPGIDYLGNRLCSPVLTKQISSVANQFGTGDCLSESFGCSGWNVSFERLLWLWGNEAVGGITKPCFHLSDYSLEGRRKRDYPPTFSYQEPWWNKFSAFTASINKMNSLLKQGEYICTTLLISPLSAAKRFYLTQNVEHPQVSLASNALRSTLENMLSIQWECDIGDEGLIADFAAVVDREVVVGKRKYSTLVVPQTEYLDIRVWNILEKFVILGGELVFIGALPSNKPESFPKSGWRVLQNRAAIFDKYLRKSGESRTVRVCENEDLKTVFGVKVRSFKFNGGIRTVIWNNSWDSKRNCVLELLSGFKNAQMVYSTYECRNLSVSAFGNTARINLEIKPGETLIIDFTDKSQVKALNKKLKRIEIPQDISVNLTEKNCLTLDMAEFKIGNEWSEKMPVIFMNDLLYKNYLHSGEEIKLKFSFTADGINDFVDMSLCVEDRYVKEISVNGKDITSKKLGWWLDKTISEYDISNSAVNGKNELIITYYWGETLTYRSVKSDFESETNRFFYPLEFESIYIRGKFDVTTDKAVNKVKFFALNQDEICLIPYSEKSLGDITVNGAYFYRGNITYSFDIDYSGNESISVYAKRIGGVAISIKANGIEKVILPREDKVDITDDLKIGKNSIVVEIIGTNRNLLGPHHHKLGEIGFISPLTFEGKYGFTDAFFPNLPVADTWEETYSAVPFGIEDIAVLHY